MDGKKIVVVLKNEKLKEIIENHDFQESELPKFLSTDDSPSRYKAVKAETTQWNEFMEKLTAQEQSELVAENKRIIINIEKIENWRERKNKEAQEENAGYSDKMQGFESDICYGGYHNLEKKYRDSRFPLIKKSVLKRVAEYLQCGFEELADVSQTENGNKAEEQDEMVYVDMMRLERYRRVDYDQFIEECAWPEYKKLLLNYVKNRNQSIYMNSVAGIAYTLEHRVEDLLATELEEKIALLSKENLLSGKEELAELEGFIPTIILIIWDKIRERKYQRDTIYYRKEEDTYYFYLPLTKNECIKFDESYPMEIEVEDLKGDSNCDDWESWAKEKIEEEIWERNGEKIEWEDEVERLIEMIWESELQEEVIETDLRTCKKEVYELYNALWESIVKKMLVDSEYRRKLFKEFGFM